MKAICRTVTAAAMLVHKKLMEALQEARREKGYNSEDELEPEQFDPDSFVNQQFNAFNIADLREH